MQLTIDSREPLEDVLRAVGSLYNVALTTVQDAPNGVNEATSRRPTKGRRSPTGGRQRTRTSSKASDTKAIRAWAADNGFEVAARGALPAAARDAYAAAH